MTARRELPPGLEKAVGELAPCSLHPQVETSLRCARCGRPICPKCVVHTPDGARCPSCARRQARRAGSLTDSARTFGALVVGFGLAAAGGAALSTFPVGLLLVIPTLALGFLVGEAVAATAGRPGGAFLALIGLFCGLSGPLLGHALLGGVVVERAASALGVAYSAPALTSFGLLLLVCGAVIAAFRAASSR